VTPTPATGTPTADSGPSTDRRFFGHPLALGSLILFALSPWIRRAMRGVR